MAESPSFDLCLFIAGAHREVKTSRPTDVTVAGHLHVDQPKLSLLSTSKSVMVLFFSSTGMYPSSTYSTGLSTICSGLALDPPVTLYMGRDKVESD